nr:uncharacterized mitochondrial protein AtMg00810-like [Tanacetum cinerariifolium]
MVPAAELTQSKPVSITAVRQVSAVVPQIKVTRPRHAKPIVTKNNSPIRRHITRSPSPKTSNLPPRVTVIKAPVVSAAQGNMSYLSDFEELNGGYVAFGGNPKDGKISGKGKIRTDSLVKFERKVDEGFLVGYSVNSKAFRVFNSRTRIVQETLHMNFLENKPNITGSGPTWLFEIDSLTRTMNYQPVIAGYRDLRAEFEDSSDNSINEVNAAGTIVLTIRLNSPNSTNTFSAAGPSNAAASPTYRKSSFIDASQLLDDPDMPELEDITYSNDEDDVGAEADFNNLETSISDEPKRVYQALKDQSWIEAMQEELLQFKMQKVWVLVNLPHGKRSIVKRIFRYLKGKPHLGLWYPKDSPVDLVAYSDRDYAGASLDRKSTTGGCQFLRCRLISWQCKKQTVVATSSTEAEYVAAASCCAQVLWIQNQLLDYGDSPLLGVNTPRSDKDRLELMELMVFLLPKVEKVGIGVNAVDLQVSKYESF